LFSNGPISCRDSVIEGDYGASRFAPRLLCTFLRLSRGADSWGFTPPIFHIPARTQAPAPMSSHILISGILHLQPCPLFLSYNQMTRCVEVPCRHSTFCQVSWQTIAYTTQRQESSRCIELAHVAMENAVCRTQLLKWHRCGSFIGEL